MPFVAVPNTDTIQADGWKSIAMSSSGTVVYALSNAAAAVLYKSTDSGITYTSVLNTTSGDKVVCSGDGSKIYVSDGLSVHSSKDSGANFAIQVVATSVAIGNTITCSDDGEVAYVADNKTTPVLMRFAIGGSFKNTVFGFGPSDQITAIACSSNGSIVYLANDGAKVRKSTDFGDTFDQGVSAPLLSVQFLNCTNDATIVLAASSGMPGIVTRSSNSGSSFVQLTTNMALGTIFSVAMSRDKGKIIAVLSGTFVEISTDSGLTWVTNPEITGPPALRGVAVSKDGSLLFAADSIATGKLWYLYIYITLDDGDGTIVVNTSLCQNIQTDVTTSAREFMRDVEFDSPPISGQILQFDGNSWVLQTLSASIATAKAYIFAATSNGTEEQDYDKGARMRVKSSVAGVPIVLDASSNIHLPVVPSLITVEPINVTDASIFDGNAGFVNWDFTSNAGSVVNRYVIDTSAPEAVYRGSVTVSWITKGYDQSGYVSLHVVSSVLPDATDSGEVPGSRCYIKTKSSIIGRDHATSNFLFDRGIGEKIYELKLFMLGNDVDEHTLYNGGDTNPAEIKVADVSVMFETVSPTLL